MFTRQKAGTLNHGRKSPGAIFDGEKFLIIGGYGKVKNEVCTLEGSTMTCVEQSEALEEYLYPGLFLVTVNFGKDVTRCWNFVFFVLFSTELTIE